MLFYVANLMPCGYSSVVTFNPPDFSFNVFISEKQGNSSSLGEFSLERGETELGYLTAGNRWGWGGVEVVKKEKSMKTKKGEVKEKCHQST